MEFLTAENRPMILNVQHVVAVSPAYGWDQVPMLGICAILLDIAPPNVPGAGQTIVTVKGNHREVAHRLGLLSDEEYNISAPEEE